MSIAIGEAEAALRAYGFDEDFAAAFASMAREGELPARVVEERRGSYIAVLPGRDGSVAFKEAELAGSLRESFHSASQFPVVGDWVSLRPTENGPALVRSVLPRRSAFVRKAPGDVVHDRIDAQAIAANVDVAAIVVAAGRDWNARRAERYLALARASGARSLVVVTKADLAPEPDRLIAEVRRISGGARTLMVCALDGRGMEELEAELGAALGAESRAGIDGGATVALLGSSGAGKSTLLNALAGVTLARVNAVREDDERGRHTTTSRQLYKLGSGVLVIDTPGMRELQLWADEEDVDSAFPEIEELAEGCRFRDCRHEGEPGCAVRAAMEGGGLDPLRYEAWRKLSKELAFLKAKGDHAAKEAERRRWRSIEMSRRALSKEAKNHGRRER